MNYEAFKIFQSMQAFAFTKWKTLELVLYGHKLWKKVLKLYTNLLLIIECISQTGIPSYEGFFLDIMDEILIIDKQNVTIKY